MDVDDFLLLPINGFIFISKSNIHGMGLFCKKKINSGVNLGPALFSNQISHQYKEYLSDDYSSLFESNDGSRSYNQIIGARYANHSRIGNVALLLPHPSSIIEMIATKDIHPGDEICGDYRPFYSYMNVDFPSFL